jgi:hypothetical protein
VASTLNLVRDVVAGVLDGIHSDGLVGFVKVECVCEALKKMLRLD